MLKYFFHFTHFKKLRRAQSQEGENEESEDSDNFVPSPNLSSPTMESDDDENFEIKQSSKPKVEKHFSNLKLQLHYDVFGF